MLNMAMDSAKLFFAGKLFQDTGMVVRQLSIGAGAAIAITVIIGLVAPVWLGALVGGAVGGFLQPILFKDLKYA